MTEPGLPGSVCDGWQWAEVDHLGEPDPRYVGTDSFDYVAIYPDAFDAFDHVTIGQSEAGPEQASAPASVVLAALVRRYGREQLAAWALTIGLDAAPKTEVDNDAAQQGLF